MQAVDAAQAIVAAQFPTCAAAFLAGSVVRGDATPTSDLDIVVVEEGRKAERRSLMAHGWPVELFIHSPVTLMDYFAQDVDRRRPSLPQMVREGVVLRDASGMAQTLKDKAQAILQAGPQALSATEVEDRRYFLTDALTDLEGARYWEEIVLIAPLVAQQAADLILAHHGQWQGQGKWLLKALKAFDARRAQQLHMALSAAYLQEQTAPLVVFAEEALDLVGGRLFEGYQRGG